MYITFLSDTPTSDKIEKLNSKNYYPEECIINGKVIYLYIPNGYGRSKLNNNYIESKLNLQATTRNFKTINKISELI